MENESKIIKKGDVPKKVGLRSQLDLEDISVTIMGMDEKVISAENLSQREAAKQILKLAQQEAKAVRERAKDILALVEKRMAEECLRGFAEGEQKGFAKVTEELAQHKLKTEEMLKNLEKECVKLVYEIAAKIIGDAVKLNDDMLQSLVHQALQSAMGANLIVYVNPNDLERIKPKETKLLSSLQAMQTLQIKASSNVKEGGCVVESDLGTIDASLEYQLEAIKKALEIE